MTAGEYDLTMEQGATFDRLLTYKPDGVNPADLTGYTARMQVRKRLATPDPPMLELTTENGRITLGGAAGTIRLYVTDEDTMSELEGRRGVYDLELQTPGGEVIRLLEGTVTIDPNVTR